MAASSSAVIVCVVFNVVVAILCFFIFSLLRTSKFGEKFYASRRFAKDIRLKPCRLAPGLFTWIWPVWTYPEGDIIDELGLDAAMYLRICNFGYHFFFWVSLWCLVCVLPINLTHATTLPELKGGLGPRTKDRFEFTTFDRCTMSNISAGSSRLWMHFFSVYVISGIAVLLLRKYNKESIKLRVLYLACARPGGASHTVLVTDIPGIAGRRVDGRSSRANAQGRRAVGSGPDLAAALVSCGAQDGAVGSGDMAVAVTAGQVDGQATGDQRQKVLEMTGTADRDLKSDQSNGHSGSGLPGSSSTASLQDASVGLPPGVMEVGTIGTPDSIAINLPLADGRRRHIYNVRSPVLDARKVAAAKLAAGMSPKVMIEAEFKSTYPEGAVVAVNTVNDQASLEPLVAEYDKIRQQLDDYLDECNYRMDQGIHVERKRLLVLGHMGTWGKQRGYGCYNRPDAIEHWTARLEELSHLINQEQDKCRELATSTAFVTFNTRMAQSMAAASLHHHDETTWRVQAAPEARELIWHNLSKRVYEKAARFVIFAAMFAVLAIFFMAPVLALQGLIDLPHLSSSPLLRKVVNAPVLKELLQAIVPGLVLLVLLYFVPKTIARMVRASGAVSESQVDFGVMNRFFIFQVIVIFLVNVVGGTFFSQLRKWVSDPAAAVTILGEAIPLVSTYFITFILLNGIAYASISSLRLGPLTLTWLLTTMAGSPKAKYRVWSQQYISYGGPVVNHTLTLLLALVYSIINPVITPIAFLHYILNGVIERYQNLYIWRRRYESFGRLWQNVFHQVMFALYLFQVCMIGLLGLKRFKYTALLVPLPFLTVVFHITSVQLYRRPWTYIAQHDAAVLDLRERMAAQKAANVATGCSGGPDGSAVLGDPTSTSTTVTNGAGTSKSSLAKEAAMFGEPRALRRQLERDQEAEQRRQERGEGGPTSKHTKRLRRLFREPSGRRSLLPADGPGDSAAAGTGGGSQQGSQDDAEDEGSGADADAPPHPDGDEPVEVAYLSRLFKISLPADMAPLLQSAEATVLRIASQPPPLSPEEMAARRAAAKLAAKEAAKQERQARRIAHLAARRGGVGSNGAGAVGVAPVSAETQSCENKDTAARQESAHHAGRPNRHAAVPLVPAPEAPAAANGRQDSESLPIPVSTAPAFMQRAALANGSRGLPASNPFTIDDNEVHDGSGLQSRYT